MKTKVNKTQQVLNHLIENKRIDTWKAIELYSERDRRFGKA